MTKSYQDINIHIVLVIQVGLAKVSASNLCIDMISVFLKMVNIVTQCNPILPTDT